MYHISIKKDGKDYFDYDCDDLNISQRRDAFPLFKVGGGKKPIEIVVSPDADLEIRARSTGPLPNAIYYTKGCEFDRKKIQEKLTEKRLKRK